MRNANTLTRTPKHRGYIGARYWQDPGGFKNGYRGFMAVFRIAGMSYGGTELLGLTVAECKKPSQMLPRATKVVFARICLFYCGALLMLGFVVPSDSAELATEDLSKRSAEVIAKSEKELKERQASMKPEEVAAKQEEVKKEAETKRKAPTLRRKGEVVKEPK